MQQETKSPGCKIYWCVMVRTQRETPLLSCVDGALMSPHLYVWNIKIQSDCDAEWVMTESRGLLPVCTNILSVISKFHVRKATPWFLMTHLISHPPYNSCDFRTKSQKVFHVLGHCRHQVAQYGCTTCVFKHLLLLNDNLTLVAFSDFV